MKCIPKYFKYIIQKKFRFDLNSIAKPNKCCDNKILSFRVNGIIMCEIYVPDKTGSIKFL